mgnify:CR=1 FL=1
MFLFFKRSYKNTEMILVDDGSTDGSNKICDKFKKKDNGVKVIHKKMVVQVNVEMLE